MSEGYEDDREENRDLAKLIAELCAFKFFHNARLGAEATLELFETKTITVDEAVDWFRAALIEKGIGLREARRRQAREHEEDLKRKQAALASGEFTTECLACVDLGDWCGMHPPQIRDPWADHPFKKRPAALQTPPSPDNEDEPAQGDEVVFKGEPEAPKATKEDLQLQRLLKMGRKL